MLTDRTDCEYYIFILLEKYPDGLGACDVRATMRAVAHRSPNHGTSDSGSAYHQSLLLVD